MTDEDRLADLLLQWEEILDQGREVPAEELCKDCPHLIGELSRRIQAMQATSWMNKPVNGGGDDDGGEIPPGPPPLPLAGRYRLDERIAEGGFGEVWRGFDQELHRTVAVKVSKPGRLGAVEQFVAEARRVARLRHPGIVAVHDVVRQDDTCFIVSDFVEGGSLRDRITGSPSPEQSARWIADVAEALAYAHREGFIHRDIKPANILIDHHGRALLGDFGIATTVEELSGSPPLSLGTLAYMSPEQVEGKLVDSRSDIYSLGVVFFELLTGRLPYQATEPTKLRRAIASGPVALFSKDDLVSLQLRRICEKCLSRDPAERYSADELAAALRALSVLGPKRWKPVAGATMLILVAVVGVITLQQIQPPTEQSLEQTATDHSPAVQPDDPAAPPTTAEAAMALGKLHFDKKDYQAAAEAFSEAVRLDPNSAEAIHRVAGSRFNLGQTEQALSDFNRAVGLAPENAEIRKHRALTFLTLGRFDDAFADLRAALELAPDDPKPYEELLALTFARRAYDHADAMRWHEALADMDQAIRLDSSKADFFHKRAACHYNLKQFEEAVADFTQAIEREPDNPGHHLNRGYAYQAMGEKEKAEADYERARMLQTTTQKPNANTSLNEAAIPIAFPGDLDAVMRFIALSIFQAGGTVKLAGGLGPISSEDELPNAPVRIEAVDLTNRSIDHQLMQLLAETPTITDLALSATNVADDHLALLRSKTNIRKLRLNDTRITNAGLEHIGTLKNLELLELTGARITDDGLIHLSRLKRLTWFAPCHCPITDAGAEHIAKMTSLRELRLNDTRLADEGIKKLSALKNLQLLELRNVRLTDGGIGALSALAHLTWLDISGTQITDDGLLAWRKPSGLRELRANGIPGVTGAGLVGFEELSNLRRLEVSRTNVSPAAIESLRQRLAGCLVLE